MKITNFKIIFKINSKLITNMKIKITIVNFYFISIKIKNYFKFYLIPIRTRIII